MREKLDLILVGGGGHCKACIDVIELEGKYNIIGVIDKSPSIKDVLNYPILGGDELIPELIDEDTYFLISLGQIKTYLFRKKISNLLKAHKARIGTVVSPLAYVSKYAQIEEGTIIMHHANVNANAYVGKHCIINTFANIEHDVIIEEYCHVSTGAIVNGGSKIGFGTFVGSNSTISNNIFVKEESVISAGAFFMG